MKFEWKPDTYSRVDGFYIVIDHFSRRRGHIALINGDQIELNEVDEDIGWLSLEEVAVRKWRLG